MPTTVQPDRVIPVRLEQEHLPLLLDVIHPEFARQGIGEEVLEGLEWRARSEGDQTQIHVLGNYRDGLLASTLGLGPILAASIGALAAALGTAGAAVIVPIVLAGGSVMSILPWRYVFRREVLSIHHVLDSLERHLLQSAPPESTPHESAPGDDD